MTDGPGAAPSQIGGSDDSGSRWSARVSVITGDRLCVRCGFNLHGQTVCREPHYGMLAVRCPECSTLASLQEYPLLDRWAGRVGLLLAVGWLAAVLVLASLTGLSLYGPSESFAGACARPAARQIGLAFAQYANEHEEPEGSGTFYAKDQLQYMIQGTDAADHWLDPEWVGEQDLGRIASGAPRLSARALAMLVPSSIGMFLWGVVWSVLLLHRRLAGRLIATGLITVLVCGAIVLTHWAPFDSGVGGPGMIFGGYWGWGIIAADVARMRFGLGPALIGVAAGFGAMAAGLAVGRRFARLLVRMLLPPNLRGPLAVLWHVDGLPSPRTRGEFWVRG